MDRGAQYVSFSSDRYDEEVLATIRKVAWTFDQ